MSHIFISYSHIDNEYARKLAEALTGEGFPVWIDDRIDYGVQWPHAIQEQLDACAAFVVVMTPRAYDSEWVQNELNRAKRLKKPIFPLLLEGDGPWLSVEATQLIDVRGGTFPPARFYERLAEIVERESAAERLAKQEADTEPQQTVPLSPSPVGLVSDGRRAGGRGVRAIAATVVGVILIGIIALGGGAFVVSQFFNRPTATNAAAVIAATRAHTATPGIVSTQISETDGMVQVFVPAGSFEMGSDSGESEERPVHTVTLDAFWIDRTELTHSMYALCVSAGACQPPSNGSSKTHPNYYGNSQFDNYPVIHVSWNDAKAYCEWAGRRLPTEAEWEKAARGTDGRIYPWGNASLDSSLLNFNFNVGDTTEVGSYPSGASPYGALDMAGNVWEWVADWYDSNYYANSPSGNPSGPTSGDLRVLRGGSWLNEEYNVRAADRGWNEPTYGFNFIGFRCARSP